MDNPHLIHDFNQLREKLTAEGYFQASRARVWGTASLCAVLFIAGAYFQTNAPEIGFLMATVGAISLVWWIHDAGHEAYFHSRRFSKFMCESLGILFLGMPQIEYHFGIHRKHHAATNVIGADPALETKPIIWGPGTLKLGEKPLPFQDLIWFFFVLPLTWPLITQRCIRMMIKDKAYLRLTMLALRWVIVLSVLPISFVFGPILITGFVLGFSATLNHFHLPIRLQVHARFPTNVFVTTQNIANQSRFVTWLMGGLNFHVEHHLFPRMPSYQLRHVSPQVREFALKHDLTYLECTSVSAVQKVCLTLRSVEVRS